MSNNLSKIINGINSFEKISIFYKQTVDISYFQLKPVGLFAYKKKGDTKSTLYLCAFDDKGIKKSYNTEEIQDVELTGIKFNKMKLSFNDMLEGSFFNSNYCKEVKIKDIDLNKIENLLSSDIKVPNKIITYEKQQKLMDYYIKCINTEAAICENLGKGSQNLYKSGIEDHKKFLNDNSCIYKLDSDFMDYYNKWKSELKDNPNLRMYLCYPVVYTNETMIPLIIFEVIYNEDNNTICYDADITPIINNKFLCENLELPYEDVEKITSEIINNFVTLDNVDSNFNDYFKSIISNDKLKYESIILLSEKISSTYSLLKDLNSIKLVSKDKISNPFKLLLEESVNYQQKSKYNEIFNVVKSNDSQIEAIRSTNDILTIIQGPPGTGKTQTILNIVSNSIVNDKTILISSSNNKAIDNIIEKIDESDIFPYILRLGNKDNRIKAMDKINSLLNKRLESIDINEVKLIKTESIEYCKKINELEEIIQKVNQLELKEKYLSTMISENEINFDELNINKASEIENMIKNNKRCTIVELINYLNNLSIKVEYSEMNKSKWYNKLLIKLGYRYDKKCTEKYIENIKNDGYRDLGITSITVLTLEDLNFRLNVLVDYIQHKSMMKELKAILNEINLLDKGDKLIKREGFINEKIVLDIKLINKLQILNINNISDSDRNILRESITVHSEKIFSRDFEAYKILLKYFPVILTTNLACPQSVHRDYKFDIAVIDEASQCTIPSSLPTIQRCNSLVIVGDDKQLNPVVTLNNHLDESYLEELLAEDYKYSYSRMSIFDLANSVTINGKKFLLNEHYRCNKDIIDFANQKFYDGKLIVKTKEDTNENNGIFYIDAKGKVDYSFGGKSAQNEIEVNMLNRFLCEKYKEIEGKSVGIITPFRKQRILIEKLLSKMKNERKIPRGFLESITVGTVHTFQGDEKEVIIYSAVISNGIKTGTLNWLSQNNNLFNVAITRAKKRFILLGDLAFIKQEGGILKELVEYKSKNEIVIQDVPNKNLYIEYKGISNYNENVRELLNPGEFKMHGKLINVLSQNNILLNIGIKIRVADVIRISRDKLKYDEFRYALSSHFDFVLFNANNSIPLCAIEFDGKYHYNDQKTIARDKMKNKICDLYKFNVHRISSRDTKIEKSILDILKLYIVNE